MKFDLSDEFSNLIDRCSSALVRSAQPVQIIYGSTDIAMYETQNEDALSKAIGEGANVYAIWTKSDLEERWKLEYLGQRKSKCSRERIKQHLFRKSERTESKLERVREAVRLGRNVAISTILVWPDYLRTSVEQALIEEHKTTAGWVEWNTHGNKKRKKVVAG